MNPAHDIDLLQVDNVDIGTAMLLSERVASGGVVVVAGDRIPVVLGKNPTLTSSFLGKEAHFPVGPYILGAALGCPVLTVFSARSQEGFSLTARLLAERIDLPRKSREAAIQSYLDTYVAALSEECVKNPLQWFNFHPFWQPPA
jgi:predicted LPLAT superfamily acyltransferase